MTASPRYRVGVVSVLVASVLWGTTGTAATFAPGVSPVAIGATAMGVGGLLQALIAWPAIRRNLPGLYRQGRIVALGVVAVAVYPLAFYTSMHLAGVAAGTVVSIGSAPVFASIVERVADHHRLTRRWLVGAGLGIGGATLLCLAESQGSTYGGIRNTLLGVVLGFLAGLTYALYSWTAHRVMATGITPRAAMRSIFGSA
ncbi:MAG: protein of unknown function transrane [Frondihabitans sp.]|nr:protein of unknown function transrane [Frondihabitans sp.]